MHLKSWEIDQDKLMSLSVCDENSRDCLWNRCALCKFDDVVENVKQSIPNFDAVSEESISYRTLASYRKSGSSTGNKSTVWLPTTTSIEDFVPVLAQSLFCHASKSTGPKVSLLFGIFEVILYNSF